MYFFHSIFLYYLFCSNLATSASSVEEIEVDLQQSSVELDIRATGDNFTAKLKKSSFQINGDLRKKVFKKLNFQWDFQDLETGNALKNKKILKWINKTHEGSFTLISITPQQGGTFLANGKMSINGATVNTKFLCRLNPLKTGTQIYGEAQINTQDFGLPIISYLKVFKVSPYVTVRLNLITSQKLNYEIP